MANPGCYPTAVQLGFLPLVEQGLVDVRHLIADAKSGVSGAGRKAEVHSLLAEAGDNFKRMACPATAICRKSVRGRIAGWPANRLAGPCRI